METEITYKWHELTELQGRKAVAAHHLAFKKAGAKGSLETMERIFNLGNPSIVFGEGEGYCRIAEESAAVMKVITREYFK